MAGARIAHDVSASSPLPYRQVIGPHAAADALTPLLESLRPAIAQYADAPPPEARAIFSLLTQQDDLAQIQPLAEGWREKYRTLVVAGAGGSGLSGKALATLAGGSAHTLVTLDNLDTFTLPNTLDALAPEHTCFLLVSKSGATLETLALAQIILELLRGKNIPQRVAAITAPGNNPLRALAAQHGFPVLDHDPALCGRFSALSAVGLLPALFMGMDAAALRNGGALALKTNLAADSPAALGAALQVHHLRKGRNINLFMPYAEAFGGLALWWRQGWAESLGKNGLGSTPVIATGTADQHSQLQLFLGGPDDKFFTFLLPHRAGLGPKLPEGHTVGDIVAAQSRATVETLERHGRPLRVFEIPKPDAFTLGALMVHFTLEILFAAALLGVHPFDQPAVEESKRLAHTYLKGKP